MSVLIYYLKREWRAVDEWLFDNFHFGLLELGQLAKDILIQVTQ